MKLKVRELVILGLMTAILFIAQVALSFLPNIELVSLLIIVYTLVFGPKVLYVIYAFAVLEGLLYGFSTWWITYLYVWTILAGATWCFRKMESLLGWNQYKNGRPSSLENFERGRPSVFGCRLRQQPRER